jgi:hypothetical protein
MSILTTNEFLADESVDNAKIKTAAGIEFSKLEKVPIAADGSNSPTADINFGNFKITNHGTAGAASDVPNWGQVQSEISAQIGTGSHETSVGTRAIVPPGSPSSGDRVLIDASLGTATGAFTGHENKIAEWDGAAWQFTEFTEPGKWLGVNDETDKLYYFDGSNWSAKDFENTTVDEVTLTKTGSLITIKNGGVGTVQLGDLSVTEAKLGPLSVTNGKLADNSVTLNKMADNSVGTDEIVNGSVTDSELATNAVTTIKILDGAVTSDKIETDAITTVKILDGAVTGAKLAANTVTLDKIEDLGGALRFISHDGVNNDVLEVKSHAFLTSSFSGTNPNKYYDLPDVPIGALMAGFYVQGKRLTQSVHYNLVTDGANIKRLQLISLAIPASGTDCEALYYIASV